MARRKTVAFDPKNTERAENTSPSIEGQLLPDEEGYAFAPLDVSPISPRAHEMSLWRDVFMADYGRRRSIPGAAQEADKAAALFRDFIAKTDDL